MDYEGVYKQRTHDKTDGCAIYFKRDKFRLIESKSVEFYKPSIRLLSKFTQRSLNIHWRMCAYHDWSRVVHSSRLSLKSRCALVGFEFYLNIWICFVTDRDNVGLVLKFSLKSNPGVEFIVATTHLLYNPRRYDVKLAQTQLMLAEIEKLAFKQQSDLTKQPEYLPIIFTGDMNYTPESGNFVGLKMLYLTKAKWLELIFNCG